MKLKKILWIVMIFVLCITSITGCSEKKEQQKETEHAMGRYVEETIEMPELVKNETEIIYKMLINPEGFIEIYGVELPKENDTKRKSFKYILIQNQWKKEMLKWMKGEESVLGYGEDKLLYYNTIETKGKTMYWKLFKIKEDGTRKEVILKDNKPIEEDYSNYPYDVKILKDNKIVITYREKCVLYQNGEKIYELENGSRNFVTWKNQLLINNSKNTGSVLYDLDERTKIREIPFNQNIENSVYTVDEDGNWYMALSSGIHRLVPSGTVWETIVDGSLNTLSSPSYNINGLIKGSENDYYVLLEGGNGKREIKHYIYRNDVATVPENTLSVVSLKENVLVRKAITEFQNENQDVKVDYKVLMEEESVTSSDAIKALNTEILAGKGADVIILDDLPISAYIEKGVLMDLNETLKPLLDNTELLPNVVESVNTNGKIFSIPAQIIVPILYGKKEAVEAGRESLSSLAEYAVSKAKQPIFGGKVYGNIDLLEELTTYYGGEFTNIKKEMDTNSFIQFLENVKKISKQTKTVEGSVLTQDMKRYSMMDSHLITNNNAECAIAKIKDMVDIYAPFETIKRIDGSYGDINSLYIPNSIVGINNGSKEKEYASKFVQKMLSEQIGITGFSDGITINQKALETFITREDDFYLKIDNFEATRPENKKIEEFIQLCKKVKVMAQTDNFLLEMIKNEADNCLSGKKTAEETAAQISEKSKAYRAEQK